MQNPTHNIYRINNKTFVFHFVVVVMTHKLVYVELTSTAHRFQPQGRENSTETTLAKTINDNQNMV